MEKMRKISIDFVRVTATVYLALFIISRCLAEAQELRGKFKRATEPSSSEDEDQEKESIGMYEDLVQILKKFDVKYQVMRDLPYTDKALQAKTLTAMQGYKKALKSPKKTIQRLKDQDISEFSNANLDVQLEEAMKQYKNLVTLQKALKKKMPEMDFDALNSEAKIGKLVNEVEKEVDKNQKISGPEATTFRQLYVTDSSELASAGGAALAMLGLPMLILIICFFFLKCFCDKQNKELRDKNSEALKFHQKRNS